VGDMTEFQNFVLCALTVPYFLKAMDCLDGFLTAFLKELLGVPSKRRKFFVKLFCFVVYLAACTWFIDKIHKGVI
jgi:hypothetical protein